MAGVEADSIRVKAHAYFLMMRAWMNTPCGEPCPLDGASSDLVEWCRSARDILEAVGRG